MPHGTVPVAALRSADRHSTERARSGHYAPLGNLRVV